MPSFLHSEHILFYFIRREQQQVAFLNLQGDYTVPRMPQPTLPPMRRASDARLPRKLTSVRDRGTPFSSPLSSPPAVVTFVKLPCPAQCGPAKDAELRYNIVCVHNADPDIDPESMLF